MEDIKFPYLRYIVTPPTQKQIYVCRPVIPAKLCLDHKAVTFDALIDSGADECTFPAWIAETLGHNVYKGKQKIFSGIGGSVLSYLHKTHLKIDKFEFVTDVYYSHEWDDMPFGLLGQAGFFSHFNINFNFIDKEILLKFRN
ncbi:MAG: aspartyl protease family protein [bacterium]